MAPSICPKTTEALHRIFQTYRLRIEGGIALFRKIHVLAIKRRRKLMPDIVSYCRQNGITSGVILGMIGFVETARLGVPLAQPVVRSV
jgi:hypothetical protein